LRSAVIQQRIETGSTTGARPIAEIKPVPETKVVSEIKPAVAATVDKSAALRSRPSQNPLKRSQFHQLHAVPVSAEIKPAPPKPETPVGATTPVTPAAVRPDSGSAPTKAPITSIKPEPAVSQKLEPVAAPSEKKKSAAETGDSTRTAGFRAGGRQRNSKN